MSDGDQRLRFLGKLFEDQLVIRSTEVREQMSEVIVGQTPFTASAILKADEIAYESEFRIWLYDEWVPEQEAKLEEILELFGNRERYADLRAAVEREFVVPLVGSGMSVPSGLKTWSGFLRSLVEYATLTSEELEEMLSQGAFEEAAEKLKEGMPNKLFDERVDHDFRLPHGQGIQGPVLFLPSLSPNLVLTTNLDDVLERVFLSEDAEFAHILCGTSLGDYRSLKNPQEPFLLKIHGDARQPSTRVLTASEYDLAYAIESDTRRELALICQNNALLCLGCGLQNGRTMQLLHDIASEDTHAPKHFAILHLPEIDKERIEREHFLAEHGVFPIWYVGNHDEALQCLLVGLLLHCGAL